MPKSSNALNICSNVVLELTVTVPRVAPVSEFLTVIIWLPLTVTKLLNLSVILAFSLFTYVNLDEVALVPVVLVVVIVTVCVTAEMPKVVKIPPVAQAPLLEVKVIIPSSIVPCIPKSSNALNICSNVVLELTVTVPRVAPVSEFLTVITWLPLTVINVLNLSVILAFSFTVCVNLDEVAVVPVVLVTVTVVGVIPKESIMEPET